ncbi:MAG TPA: hypothetical protein VL652_16705 [Kutzneria sp.]|nr:hypothetical protein [Kutzneria sp.]
MDLHRRGQPALEPRLMGPRRDDRRPWDGPDEPRLDSLARAALAVLAPLVLATVVAVALVGLAAAGRL